MSKSILVIGESCLDVFYYCDCTRLAPEAPVPILDFRSKTENRGMAYNVFKNIQSLNVDCNIVTNYNWKKITKTRLVDYKTNQMFLRLDNSKKYNRVNLDKIDFSKYGCVVISDYDKGFLLEEDISKIADSHSNTFLDTKKIIGDWARDIKFIKINEVEYEKSKKIFDKKLYFNKLVKTVGPKGCDYKDKNYSVPDIEVKDVSGAGDTFIAGLACNYLHTKDIVDSIKFANKCATQAVSQKGVVSLSKLQTFSGGKPIWLS